MALDLTQLRLGDLVTFLTVERASSISRAARELKVTPSQVSKTIARLEEQLDMRLLARGARGVQLTETALRILPEVKEVVVRLQRLGLLSHQDTEEVTVAAPSYIGHTLLPSVAEALPELRLRALEQPPAMLRALSGENVFDLAISVGIARLPDAWDVAVVGELQKGLFASPALARTLTPPLTAESFKHVPFVSPIYIADGQFIPIGDDCPLDVAERRLGHQVETVGLALELAVRSSQLVFGPRLAACRHLAAGLLEELKVHGWDVREPVFVACNSERVTARLKRRVCDVVARALAELQA